MRERHFWILAFICWVAITPVGCVAWVLTGQPAVQTVPVALGVTLLTAGAAFAFWAEAYAED